MNAPAHFVAATVRRVRFRLPTRLSLAAACAVSGVALFCASPLQARPVPANLGNGLDKLVESNLAVSSAALSGVQLENLVTANGKTYLDEATAAVATSSLSDDRGRLLVRVTLDGTAPFREARRAMEAAASSLTITAVDRSYKAGVLNAYVDVADVPALASARGVRAVILEWKPRHNRGPLAGGQAAADPRATVGETLTKVGTTFDQGVTQHRVDQISSFFNPSASLNLAGQGMQIACISNSFAANTSAPASVDVTNNDLPGSASATQTTPVFVLQDDLSSSASDDEGRGMLQIVYKMAPFAKLGFATADTGEVGFANNIRGLAGLPGYTVAGQTFAADTICDDVGYFDEPFFQDGIIGYGIDDVAAAGVAYFSSAANDIGTNGYDSDTRWVANGTGLTAAAGNTALAGTNINLTNVPPALYAGGFHNFNPNPGQLDVAQTVNIAANNTVPTVFQWNDPYDQNTSVNITSTLLQTSGTYTNADLTYTTSGPVTAGTAYQVIEAANNSTFDGIITVYRSDGTTVIAGPQDTGTDEVVRFIAPVNDTNFVIKVGHFSTTTGAFTLTVQSFSGFTTPGTTTSLSILAFRVDTGAYVPASSLTSDATATNQPLQLGYTNRTSAAVPQIQYVIARTVVPAAGFNFPTHLRYLLPGNGRAGYGPAEYFTYNTVTTGGHAMANGCNGCAAYSVFRPSLPETFTSPGPVTIYYNKQDQRLATPEVRLQPRVAFADGANVSANLSAIFASDDAEDPDTTQGQFFGTSAASPHAAAIAALVLQNKGGRRSVTPAQMTSILQRSTFPHDLDPNYSSGAARVTGGTTGPGKVTISISSDGSGASATGLTATGGNDTNAFTVNYVGGSSITSLVFNPGGTNADGGVSGGNNGVTYNSPDATVGGTVTYFENSLPGVMFAPASKAFTLNPTTNTGTINNAHANSVTGATALGSNPSNTAATQYYTLSIGIPNGNFTNAKSLRFTVGRGLARINTVGSTYNAVTNATTGQIFYSADIFGGGVSLPSGTVTSQGMLFTGTTADGGTFSGMIMNRIGFGWATQDGFGFVNAEAAVQQTVQ